MRKILWTVLLVSMIPTLAFADGGAPQDIIPYPDWIVFGLALILIAWWSAQAFDRPSIDLAEIPTYPRYMTRRSQYQLGRMFFVLLSLIIYGLMVRYHKDLPEIIHAAKPDWSETLKTLIDKNDPSYLVVIIVASACFLTLLKLEHPWNFYLQFRDMIYSWVSIPCLTNKIINLTTDHLLVPFPARSSIPQAHSDWSVHEADFDKNIATMDRAWAELCYLQHWILDQHHTSSDTTFFSEKSFAWDKLNDEFTGLTLMIAARKAGLASTNDQSSAIMDDIESYRKKLGRLIACYLVFMNSTRSALIAATQQLGISLGQEPSENPLRYAAIYLAALIMAVYMGVYFSAVTYDLLHGIGISTAIVDQNTEDLQRWVFLAFGDYGVPILGILILRYLVWRINPIREYSIIVAYAWIFLIAAVLSTLGLTIMAELVGRNAGHWDQFFAICQRETRWAIGPALICVYMNHYLDRQIDPNRPNIEHPGERPFRRVGYAILFTLVVIAFTLPSMPTIQKPPSGPWELPKLRSVAMGTIFFITIAMALVAQFALTKPRPKQPAMSNTPENPDAQLVAT
jgi:hypothetical protein